MCGIAGILNVDPRNGVDSNVLQKMTHEIRHRGPDDSSVYVDENIGLGFRRLSIIDLKSGNQPFFNKDKSVVLICNGEIFNYKELRTQLVQKGHHFQSDCDVEVILHLYEEYGIKLLEKLNGQFAFVIYDRNIRQLFMARDHFGICPLFYYFNEEVLVFASEIKSILRHPAVKRKVELNGLDQLFSFPGIIAPTTLFKDISNLSPGHYLLIKDQQIFIKEYWDLNYPTKEYDYGDYSDAYYTEKLEDLLLQSVNYRLNSDVPVGFYLSGGLDSSLIGSLMKHTRKNSDFNSFSICFPGDDNKVIDEGKYQRLVSQRLAVRHNEIEFNWSDIDRKLKDIIYYSETPLKESYNVCSLALSKRAREENVKVVLCGEGADELFGGYAGYKFDRQRGAVQQHKDLEHLLEDQVRDVLWGDPEFIYERNEYGFKETKQALYSNGLNEVYDDFNCLKRAMVDHRKVKNRHVFNQRSYIDLKLRLAGHLIADHGDRMTFANGIEGRYPFLDVNVVEFVRFMPPDLRLRGMKEKYVLKEVASKYLPKEIINREKFGFVAPGSPELLKNNIEWINDLLSYNTIKRQNYFNPDTVERLKKMYMRDDFILTPPYDNDLLIIILTFNIFLEVFEMPGF